ncbi:MAG: SDR family oxidoreductase [Sporolactobacillus sp.]
MGETALITGASSGIGHELAHVLARAGYDLIVVARSAGKLEELKAALPERKVTVIIQDLAAPGAAQTVFRRVRELGLSVNVLINNAGFGLVGAFDTLEFAEQSDMIHVNVLALTQLTYLFLPELKKNSGKILNVASTAAFQPGPFMAVYFASKAYVLSLSRALAEELRGSGVTVTTLCPGPTHTQFGAVAHAEKTRMFAKTMDVRRVAATAFQAMLNGKVCVIPGTLNAAGAIGAKLLPAGVGAKVVRFVTNQTSKSNDMKK